MAEEKKIDGAIVRLENVRLAFPQLFEAAQVNGEGKPAFSASFLLDPKKHANLIAKIKQITKEVANTKWGPKSEAILKACEANNKLALKDGNLKPEYAGFADNLFISARSATKPKVFDKDKTELGVTDGKPYAGCYVDASIQVWAQDNKFGKRINASLRGVQFRKDGDAFAGGAPADESEFEDLSDTGEDTHSDLA